jgi:hypothetical protein
MDLKLSSNNISSASPEQRQKFESQLRSILQTDFNDNLYAMMAGYQRILADNQQREQWPIVHDKLLTLFMCGKAVPLNGPMIGIPVEIRDSDFFRETAKLFGKNRSLLASIEVMATAWNATFADTGLWMGKTFEPVTEAVVREKSDNDPGVMSAYHADTSRIGRNFFREPPDPNALQSIALPALEQAWKLKDRPMSIDAEGFLGELLAENLEKEKAIPYSKTGGVYLANLGTSVVPEMQGKQVYQLNYRWPNLKPVFPMTLLVDELVQIGEGIYLGQLVYATKHFSLGAIDLPFVPGEPGIELGEPYEPKRQSLMQQLPGLITDNQEGEAPDYGYQNNGFFLMMDPVYAKQVYADDAFPQLRPRRGEMGFEELGYDVEPSVVETSSAGRDWVDGWRNDKALQAKFTTLITEPSTQTSDGDVAELLHPDESVLQMLQRISNDISAQTKHEDHLKHFEPLHRLFRSGVAPGIEDGVFHGSGSKGYNVRLEGSDVHDWYGEDEITRGFDYYHGANLNLHWGFSETFCPDRNAKAADASLIPGVLGQVLQEEEFRGPNVMNMVWHSIGKYIFPWAGKSFEKISPRKLSILLDESSDLDQRYPERVRELKHHLASFPHYALVEKNQNHYWSGSSKYTEHLASGSWDRGMSDEDKNFWEQEAAERWVMGYNLQDSRIVAADALMRIADMNYRVPEAKLQQASETSGSPFERQGYSFLGAADRESILPMNNGDNGIKPVFQFHYRFPMIGGPVPIGFCLDELVEIADGLFLGQLIYATALDVPFHSSVDPSEFKYQLFGYFLLLDDDWERHRQAINLDTID